MSETRTDWGHIADDVIPLLWLADDSIIGLPFKYFVGVDAQTVRWGSWAALVAGECAWGGVVNPGDARFEALVDAGVARRQVEP